MNRLSRLSILLALGACGACDADDDSTKASDEKGVPASTVLELDAVTSKPEDFEWFDFRPNVKKLILSGAAETEHVAILWYTTEDGGVGLHYHAKTESVYVIEGTQTDAKGDYKTGTVYFNPPGSGHEITRSSGFFLLAYAAPPDFMKTDLIGEYTPIRIDTNAADLMSAYEFEKKASGLRVYDAGLDSEGGMRAEFIENTSTKPYAYSGNYVLVLRGSCAIGGTEYAERTLVVAKSIEPQTYAVAAPKSGSCVALGVSF